MSTNYAKYGGLGGGSGGSGTVTTVSVVSANGFAGVVATPTTTPAITLSTTITGLLQGNGTAISAYTGGNLTDAGTDGIVVTGGSGAVIGSGTSIAQHVADSTHNGYLSSTDWSTFNNKQAVLTLGNLTDVGTDGIVVTGGSGAVIGSGTSIAQHVADSTHNGYLSSTDWNTFNGKQSTVSFGPFGSAPSANGGVISSGVITLEPADATHPGGVSTTTQTIAGSKTFPSHSAFGPTASVDPSGSLSIMALAETFVVPTAVPGFARAGINSQITVNPSGDDVGTYLGLYFQAVTDPTSTHDIEFIAGCYGEAYHQGAGTVNYLTGFNADPEITGTGTVNNLFGYFVDELIVPAGATATNAALFYGAAENDGTITNNYGLFVDTPTNTGTLTNNYGIFLNDQAVGTNSWAIKTGTGRVQLGALGSGVVHSTGAGLLSSSPVSLTADVTGMLPVTNGGTGISTLTANNVILGNGTSTPTFVAPSTSGNVLTSNGTTWTSAAIPANTIVSASVYLASNYVVVGGHVVIYDTALFDTNSAYSTITGLYTCPSAGKYLVTVVGSPIASLTGLFLQKNSTAFSYFCVASSAALAGGSQVVSCSTNDTLGVFADSSVTMSGSSAPYVNAVTFSKLGS